jgi:acetoin utilization protein AcuB
LSTSSEASPDATNERELAHGIGPALLARMRVAEIMNRHVIVTGPSEEADRAWSLMRTRRLRHLVVMEGKRVVGVLSDRDLGGRSGVAVRKGRTVAELMTRQVVVAEPSTTIRQAANLMRGRTIGCLPVLDDGRVVGIVTTTDILDQLGRGSTRPTVRAERRVRRAPSGHHELGGVPRVRVPARPEERAPRQRRQPSRAPRRR